MKNKIFKTTLSVLTALALAAPTVAYAADSGISFTNVYTADSAYADIEVSKVFHDGTLTGGDFDFVLFDENGNTVDTVSNDADGNVVFEDVEFTSAGTSVFYIYEVGDSEDETVEYDDMTVVVTAETVYDDETEGLSVTLSYPDDTVFDNYYLGGDDGDEEETADAAVLQLGASVTLVDESDTGRELEADEFSFKLYDGDGNTIATATNTDAGDISWPDIEITEEGEYTYTVAQVIGSDSHITYDETVFTVSVTAVESDGEIVISLN